MILSMKNISIAFDMQASKIPKFPSFVEFFGYLLCPASCIVGPWCSFVDYRNSQLPKKLTGRLCYQVGVGFLLSILFALFSNCIVFMVPDKIGLISYRDALGFRTSHYFISFMSQIQMLIAGFDVGTKVTKPLDIEIPRSLVTVVVAWNIPMHQFIKQFIFQNFKKFGNFVAILAAYATSALLHGLNFQLAAVLLSLGFFTYIEYMLRSQLAEIFNICIMANPCKLDGTGKCLRGHLNQEKKYIIYVVNIFFGLITIFNLAYLGVMFEASFSVQEQGFSLQNAISKWTDLKFFGHILMMVFYLIYLVLK
jgi:porcupine-like protein